MENKTNKINCPKCGFEIDIDKLESSRLEIKYQKKYSAKLAEEKKYYENQLKSLTDEKRKLDQEKRQYQDKIDKGIQEGVKTEKQKFSREIKREIEEEKSDQIKSMEEELNHKSKQLKEFNKTKSEFEKIKREMSEQKDTIEAESEKKYNRMLKEEKERIHRREEDKIQLKLSEREHVILQLKEQLQEAQRKAEQGSMQIQGEVQELAIEGWLKEQFPLDTIDEIKKGARGADCLQIVHTRTRQNCGSIYYESKRTKSFHKSWIEKFKTDIREKDADIGVLVTESMPGDMERMGMQEGIWVCSFEEVKGLSVALRDSLIKINRAIAVSENKGDKMGMLYDYLTGNEFRLQIEAIVEGFIQMQSDLDSEKRSMQGIWKKREKQIQKVLLNTNYMYSSIKGIAGNAVQAVKLLELPNGQGE